MRPVGVQVNSLLDAQLSPPYILNLLSCDSEVKTTTGLETARLFPAIVECCRRKLNRRHIDFDRNVVLTLMKLRHALPYTFLALLSVPASTIFKLVIGTVLQSVIPWPSPDHVGQSVLCCAANFQKTIVVLDCTEVTVESSRCAKCRNST